MGGKISAAESLIQKKVNVTQGWYALNVFEDHSAQKMVPVHVVVRLGMIAVLRILEMYANQG